jgi:hypothetical protein
MDMTFTLRYCYVLKLFRSVTILRYIMKLLKYGTLTLSTLMLKDAMLKVVGNEKVGGS